MVLGWQIWESKILVEAEFHALWESNDGQLKDISAKKDPQIKNILFVRDDTLVYEEKQKDNIRLNKTNNKLVDDFIEVCKAEFQFLNKGDRATQYELKLSNEEQSKLLLIALLKKNIYSLINNGKNENNNCFCKSKILYKNCHGKELKNMLNACIN